MSEHLPHHIEIRVRLRSALVEMRLHEECGSCDKTQRSVLWYLVRCRAHGVVLLSIFAHMFASVHGISGVELLNQFHVTG